MLKARRPSLAREQHDRREDRGAPEHIEEPERRAEQRDGEHDRRERLDGGEHPRLARRDVLRTAEVERERRDGAEEDEIEEREQTRPRPLATEERRTRHRRHGDAAYEHPPADDERRAPRADEALRRERVDGARHGGDESPEERRQRDDERVPVAVRHEQERPEEGEQHAENLEPARPFPAAHCHVEHDHRGHEILQDRRCRGIAVADGREIGIRDTHHAADAEKEQLPSVPAILPDTQHIAPVLHGIEREQDDPSEHEPCRHEPFRREARLLQEVLPRDAGTAPEDAAEHRAEHAPAPVSPDRIIFHPFSATSRRSGRARPP